MTLGPIARFVANCFVGISIIVMIISPMVAGMLFLMQCLGDNIFNLGPLHFLLIGIVLPFCCFVVAGLTMEKYPELVDEDGTTTSSMSGPGRMETPPDPPRWSANGQFVTAEPTKPEPEEVYEPENKRRKYDI